MQRLNASSVRLASRTTMRTAASYDDRVPTGLDEGSKAIEHNLAGQLSSGKIEQVGSVKIFDPSNERTARQTTRQDRCTLFGSIE